MTPAEMIAKVKQTYTGAQQNFVLARLSLKAGFNVKKLTPDDDPQKAQRLSAAIKEICPEVSL